MILQQGYWSVKSSNEERVVLCHGPSPQVPLTEPLPDVEKPANSVMFSELASMTNTSDGDVRLSLGRGLRATLQPKTFRKLSTAARSSVVPYIGQLAPTLN